MKTSERSHVVQVRPVMYEGYLKLVPTPPVDSDMSKFAQGSSFASKLSAGIEACNVGNFEKAIPDNIRQLKDKIATLQRESYGLNWGHECDCQYCTEGSEIPPETEERDAQIKTEIQACKTMIKRLERHATLVGSSTQQPSEHSTPARASKKINEL